MLAAFTRNVEFQTTFYASADLLIAAVAAAAAQGGKEGSNQGNPTLTPTLYLKLGRLDLADREKVLGCCISSSPHGRTVYKKTSSHKKKKK